MQLQHLRSTLFGAVAALALASTAGAQTNLVTNGSFENGLTGWSAWYNPWGAGCTTNDASVVSGGINGSYALQFGSHDCFSAVQQTLPTIAGHTYATTYWLRATGDPTYFDPNSPMGTDANGFYFLLLNDPSCGQGADNVWRQSVTCTNTWNTNNADFILEGFAQNGAIQVDSVTVYDVTDVSSAPEPSSLALLGTGLVGLVPMVRRKIRS